MFTYCSICDRANVYFLFSSTVKSRSLLSYEDHGGMEEHPAGLGGEYPEWDAQMEVMATWRLEQQHHHEEQLEALKHTEEAHASFSHSNDTHNSQKTAVLIDLNTHR